ncbi:MAG: rhombosortase [Gammaproteobacteria bacterium]|nr:rhombosortase [Gammaproteobacteria bacterium]
MNPDDDRTNSTGVDSAPPAPAPGSRPADDSPHMLAISLAVVSAAAMIGGSELLLWLRYEREAILSGQVWRMLTAHITHLGWEHLALNVAGLALLWLMFARLLTIGRWSIVVIGSGLGVSTGLLAFNPELQWYVGMSGLLHGMFVAGAVAGIHAGYRFEWALLGLVAVKLAWERVTGPATSTEQIVGGSVVVDSHLYGAIAGLLVILAIIAFDRARAGTAPTGPA